MNNLITAFKEHKTFKQNKPWDANTLLFPTDLTTPPHYADTIEVLLCCDVKGEIYIGGQKTTLCGKQVFYIPPKIVHSIFYKKNCGFAEVLKINIDALKPMLNIDEFLKYKRLDLYCLPTLIPCFDEASAVADVFHKSDNIFEICQNILHLFNLFTLYCGTAPFDTIKNNSSSHNLRKIINWTEENYLNKISIDDVAHIVGYEKHYFCNKFKKLTGISYINYVNNLRIQHACRLLANCNSVSNVCEKCGFENISYFIQLFKKIIGITPKVYSTGLSADKYDSN